MKITIVIAVYNGATTLRRCLDSVAAQTYQNRELIVVDGGSADGTVEILNDLTRGIDYWVSEPDKGVYDAWNKALAHATGDWIIFLGADDSFYGPDVLQQMSVALQDAYPAYRVVYGRLAQVDRHGETIRLLGNPWSLAGPSFSTYMTLPHPATFNHRTLFAEFGAFDTGFAIAGDYEFLLRELPARPALFVADVIVTAMQVGGLSATPANNLKMLAESRRARAMRGVSSPSLYYPLAYAKNYVRMAIEGVLGRRLAGHCFDALRRATGRRPYWTRL